MNVTAELRSTYTTPLPVLTTRDEIAHLLNERGLVGCGVEVGVQTGLYSETLLRTWQGAHLISVDPWREDAPDAYVDIANRPQDAQDANYEATRARLEPFGRRSSIWRATSVEAAARIPDHCLDFVYLDARHDFDSVVEDLEAWLPKLRPGGILAGHDYVDGHFPAGVFGVKSAVDGFFDPLGIAVHTTLLDVPWISWLVEIPLDPAELPARATREAAADGGARSAAHGEPAADGAEVRTGDAKAKPGEIDVMAAASPPPGRRPVDLRLALESGPRTFKLELDAARMSQRMMLECFDAGQLYEAETSRLLVTILRPGDCFVDVGAHVGYFSMLAGTVVGPAGRVVSFEPEQSNFEHLLRHVELNGFAHVTPLHAAVAAAEGRASFHVNADNDGGHALWEVGLHPFNERSRSAPSETEVDIVTLDGFLAREGVGVPRAIKIDVEGAEHAVVLGGLTTLAAPVPFVIAEINHFGLERMGTGERALRDTMQQLGYQVYGFVPGEDRIQELGEDQYLDSPYVFNLVFVHPSAL